MEREETGQFRYACILIALIVCAMLLSLRVIWIYLANPQRFPINTVKVIAPYQHVTRQQLESVMAKYMTNGFFALSTNALQKELYALPWCDQIHIERIWPDVLKITLSEKTPIARWNTSLMTGIGELLPVDADEKSINNLPLLNGPFEQKNEVLHIFQKLSKLLEKYHLQIAAIQLRENQAWELLLTNGIVLHLGKRDLEARLQRFCGAYIHAFVDKAELLSSVDLRYERGMAVHWKDKVKRDEHG